MRPSLPFDADLVEGHVERLACILDAHALTHIEYLIDGISFKVERTHTEPITLLSTHPSQGSATAAEGLSSPKTGSAVDPASDKNQQVAFTATDPSPLDPPGSSDSQAVGHQSSPQPDAAILHVVKAPLIGVAYRSKEPGVSPFVEVGDTIEEGAALCLVEAMKMFNEVKAPVAGTINEIHFEDGALVEHGAPLFTLTISSLGTDA